MVDEKTGQTHDFTRKKDVIRGEVLLPNGAPERFRDRSVLWNAVEEKERRKDAQLAREITISLPRELNEEQNWDLARSFVQETFVDLGMIADINFHRGHKGGEDQPHAHVMLTMREVSEDGFGQKARAWNNRALLSEWREQWADHCNLGLAKHGFDVRIDHRTLEAQGIDLEPQNKLGPKAVSEKMARFAEHQAIAQRNGERLLADPGIALTALSRQQSTFSHHDIARFVNRHTIDRDQFSQVYGAIKAHPDLVILGLDERGLERFSTTELVSLEMGMMERVITRSESSFHALDEDRVSEAMSDKGLSLEQEQALRHITQEKDLSCVVGYAGTGKSYMLGAAREAWELAGYRVQGMTLSGIAAENLASGSGIESTTIASRLWHWDRGLEKLGVNDVVVIDEAGMIGSRLMARVMEEAESANAKVVLVGDPEQLQSIEAGAAFRAIVECVGATQMSDIRRQREDWQKQATQDFATAKTAEGLSAYIDHDNVHAFPSKDQAMDTMVERWDEVRGQSQHQSQIMLAHTRAEVRTLNEKARQLLHEHQLLGQDHLIETARGERSFAENDRVYFLRNENRELGVKNGTLGTIDSIEGDRLWVSLDSNDTDSQRTISFSLSDYNDIDHGYAATVYKAQGVTVDRSHVLASKYFDRHLTYVAMSRHREGADLYYSTDEFPRLDDLSRCLSREKSKDTTLDYGVERDQDHETVFSDRDRSKEVEVPVDPDISLLEEIDKALDDGLGDWDSGIQDDIREIIGSEFDDHAMNPSAQRDASLNQFMRDFERDNPELAQDLARSVLPRAERHALDIIDDYKACRESGSQHEIEGLIQEIREDIALLPLIEKHNSGISSELSGLLEQSIEAETVREQQETLSEPSSPSIQKEDTVIQPPSRDLDQEREMEL